ncbi:carboxypeptidase M32 [Alicyclobacillus sp. SO9]|uniref:carboxypeptidase M32 n=1 Tax=Alicyclobacillus sp. SO9 TaxID=2665646 RepID=UPI0018E7D6CE|nr:carboxypeptidase M32 [Alicyclobacillus sp. SO9]QQE80227.1 carboxypeptidase M32 [Alicyclobacillus sp. SO9]
MGTQETAQKFRAYVEKMLHYSEAIGLMEWDLRTGAPKQGAELRAEAIGTLSSEVFRMQTAEEMGEYLDRLSTPEALPELDEITAASVTEMKKEYERNSKIPAERFHEFVVLASKAESIWEEAKDKSDFAMFRPYLEQIVAFKREFVEYWGYTDNNKYDTLLDQFEPGLTVAELDPIFANLRRETVDLLQAVTGSGQRVDESKFERRYDPQVQRQLSIRMLEQMGYDFRAGRIDSTVHPFMTALNRYDTRVTTKYLLTDMRSALFSTIHEGGHALYEQGISPDLIGTPLCGGVSNGIHESQSRFWENMIGRSRAFWEYNYKSVLELFPSQFADISLEDFYRGVNVVKPSLIRIEADELTYNLHIMVRYEIEKELVNGSVEVKDLPELWRQKMKDYIGLEPKNDGEGVLQDVHWSGGEFGYFPTYALGNIYAAQFAWAMERDNPNYMDEVRHGELTNIRTWLHDKIHRYGKLRTPSELVEGATGKPLDSQHLVDYLKNKFSALYGL